MNVLPLFPVTAVVPLHVDDELDPSGDSDDDEAPIFTRSGGHEHVDRSKEDTDIDGINPNERDGEDDRDDIPKVVRLLIRTLLVGLSTSNESIIESSSLRLYRR